MPARLPRSAALLAILALSPLPFAAPGVAGPFPTSPGPASASGASGSAPRAVPVDRAISDFVGVVVSARDIRDDSRARDWAAMARARELESLAAATLADLRGPAPHPEAAWAWAWAEWQAGRLVPGETPALPADAPPSLALEAALFLDEWTGRRDAFAQTDAAAVAALSYPARYAAAWTFRDMGRPAEYRAALEALLRDFPADLNAADWWPMEAVAGREAARAFLRETPEIAGTPAARMLAWRLARGPLSSAEDLAQARAWVVAMPRDLHGLRRLARAAAALHRPDLAASAALRALEAAPWRSPWDATRAGEALIRLGRDAEAERIAERLGPAGDPARAQAWKGWAFGKMLEDAGEWGRARAAYAQGEAAGARLPLLTADHAHLIRAEGYEAEAEALAARMTEAEPSDYWATAQRVRALNARSRHAEAGAALQAYVDAGGVLDDDLLDLGAAVDVALGREGNLIRGMLAALTGQPENVWLLSNFAFRLRAVGKLDQAFEMIRAQVAREPNAWRVARLADWGREAGREVEIEPALRAAIVLHPWSEDLWKALAGLSDDPAAIWAEAAQAAPDRAFPAIRAAALNDDAPPAAWRDAVASLSAAYDRLTDAEAPDGERGALLLARARTVSAAFARAGDVAPEDLSAALDDLAAAEAFGADMLDTARLRVEILTRLQRRPALDEAADALLALDPDEGWRIWFDNSALSENSAPAFRFARLSRAVERRPNDVGRLHGAALRHAKYGGSPVVALALVARAKKTGLADAGALAALGNEERKAMQLLGDARPEAADYMGSASLADSERYIGWFDAARREARESEVTIRALDLSAMRVVAVHGDGIERERVWDPVTGRLTRLRVGATAMSIGYDPRGEIARVAVGDGTEVTVSFAPAMGHDRGDVAALAMTGRPALAFERGPEGGIARVTLAGLGAWDPEADVYTPEEGSTATRADFTAVMQGLVQDAVPLLRLVESAPDDALDAMPYRDQTLEALRARLEATTEAAWALPEDDSPATLAAVEANELDWLAARRALAAAQAARAADHRANAAEASDGFEDAWYTVRAAEDRDPPPARLPEYRREGIEAIRGWAALQRAERPLGLPDPLWDQWEGMRDWAFDLDAKDVTLAGALGALQAEIAAAPLHALDDGGWLSGHALANPGFWQAEPLSRVLPERIARGAETHAVLVRRNGDLVVGTSRGLAVKRRGFWEWWAFDAARGGFSNARGYDDLDAFSAVTALAEDGRGRLWLGLGAGLAMLEGDYADPPALWRAELGQTPRGGVAALLDLGDGMLLGGPGGLALLEEGADAARPLDPRPVMRLAEAPEGALVLGEDGLRLRLPDGEGGADRMLLEGRVDDAIFDPARERLYALRGGELFDARALRGRIDPLRLTAGQEAIAATDAPRRLALVPISDDLRIENAWDLAPAVLTDRGIAIRRRDRFAMLTAPGGDRILGIDALASFGGQLLMATDAGIATISRGQVAHLPTGAVADLVSAPEQGAVFAAAEGRILAIRRGETEPEILARADAQHLALAPDGALIAHDGTTVIRIAPGSADVEELFDAAPHPPYRGRLEGLLAASDGSIWAAAGSTLYRWREGAPLQVWSWFDDREAFPTRSQWLSGVFETVDHRILIVASNEGHLDHQGVPLKGGLFQLSGDRFVPAPENGEPGWFLTSYTPLGDGAAIAGTLKGFAADRGGRIAQLRGSGDATYDKVLGRMPALYLGTRGAQLDDDTWLFGAAGGVVGWRAGTWFIPDRLNWMLPDQGLAAYGSRTVSAIATDADGRILIGTDAGLTLVDPKGAGAAGFLVSEGRGETAFAALEKTRMAEVRDVLAPLIPESGKAGDLARALAENRRRLAVLEEAMERAKSLPAGGTDAAPPAQANDLGAERARAERRQLALLGKLEKEEPVLFHMLQLNPLDLRASARRLPDDVTVLQYMPTEGALLINLVSRRQTEIAEVKVPREALERMARRAAALLARQARALSAPDPAPTAAAEAAELEGLLGRLYDVLLRPVEHRLAPGARIITAPAGALAYLPFPALIRGTDGGRPHYAIEDHAFATAPSLYILDMLTEERFSLADRSVVFGDPDGTLPGARDEAREVAKALGVDQDVELRIGEGADFDTLAESVSTARFVHLAMHGKLDAAAPQDSFLLLADRRRMTLPDIMTLDLHDAELVFLSACETGLGADGLEYRTIAHAFAHAGAPAVAASLWQVDDQATRELALGFYDGRLAGQGNAAALAAAKRAMIAKGGRNAAPAAWASFELIGQP